MAKRKSGALKSVKLPPTRPSGIDPYSQPYSLGDIEFRAELENRGGIKDDPVAELALRRIEQLTGGDYGQVLKYILPRKKGVEKSDSEKRLDEVINNYLKVTSASDTNMRGLYLPTESAKRDYSGVRSKDPNLPEIFIQQPTVYKQEVIEGMSKGKPVRTVRNIFSKEALRGATKEGTKFKPGYFERLLETLGIKDVDRSLERRRKEGTMPTKEDMQEAKEIMPFERTTRHELTHYGLDLLRALGYKLPSYTEYDDPETKNVNEALQREERYVSMLDKLIKMPGYKEPDSEYNEFGQKIRSSIEKSARDALRKERGYNMGGLVAMLKSFK